MTTAPDAPAERPDRAAAAAAAADGNNLQDPRHDPPHDPRHDAGPDTAAADTGAAGTIPDTAADPATQPPAGADADVLIVGAGPAGLALAAALADAGLRCMLLEQQPRAALDEPADDGREIALTHRARRVMQALGMWPRLPEALISPLNAARVIDGSGAPTLGFDAPAPGPGQDAQPLGWLVPNHAIRRAALQAALARPGVRLQCEARVTGLQLPATIPATTSATPPATGDARPGALATLTLADGRTLRAPLVVAADSRLSATRRLAGIGAQMRDFGRSVVVGPVAHTEPHQGIAWECFHYGNTLALLPMPGQRASAVVTLPASQAGEWLALDDAAFAARIQAQSGGRLGTLRAAGPRTHYPLVGVYAQRFVAPRFALVGDAAVGMHPVTAHGYNFGLYGIERLARLLASAHRAGQDIGAPAVLQPYEAEHRRVTAPIYHGTNLVVGLFTDERPAARWLRRAVLTASGEAPGLSQLVKAGITAQLTGQRPPWVPAWAEPATLRVLAEEARARVGAQVRRWAPF